MEATLSDKPTQENVEKALKEYHPNPALQSALAIMPKSFQAVMEMANVFAKSGMVPDAMKQKPEACAIAIMHGLELGVSPSQAVNNIMVINGRPSVWGDLMLALAIGSGQMEFFDEDAPDVAVKQGFGRCTCKRVGSNNPITRTFSIEDGRRAGLLTKDTWRNYPGRMLMYRARSWALRDCIPHVLKGLMMREEAEDYGPNAVPVQMPERKVEPAVAPTALREQAQEAEIIPSEVNDAIEPVNTNDGLVDDLDRKELFKLRSEAGISLQDTKSFLKQTFNVDDTAKLTKEQAEQLKVWFTKNARK